MMGVRSPPAENIGEYMRFYKYLSTKEACINVVGGNIRFSPISELNDPSELFNLVNRSETDESLRRLRREGYSDREMEGLRRQESLLARIAPEMMRIGLPRTKEEAIAILQLPLYADLRMLQLMLDSTVKTIIERTGIFCVSERYDSYPMWAHYANNAKGYIVEFDDLRRVYEGDETGVLNTLRPVIYATPRPSVTFDPESHVAIFFLNYLIGLTSVSTELSNHWMNVYMTTRKEYISQRCL